MGGTNYDVKCKTCGIIGYLEMYTDGWNNIRVDTSDAECLDCEKKANPQDWFDSQCPKCAKWFNKRGFDQGGIEISGGTWICNDCVKKIVLT